MIDLYLIRHPEAKHNETPEIIGGRSNNSPVSPLGEKQTYALYERLIKEGIVFDEVYSSPAVRTLYLANFFVMNDPQIIVDSDLQEIDQGEWTGRKRVEVYTPEIKMQMNADSWNFRAPDGESQNEVGQRGMKFINKYIIDRYPKLDRDLTIGVFGHGLAFKCLLRNILEFDPQITWRFSLENTSITQLKYDGRWWPIRINDAAHIYGLTA